MKIKLAVSACLLGKNVRYDGKNKFFSLAEYFEESIYELIGICPEVEMGLPTPREPIQLLIQNDVLKLVQVKQQTITFNEMMQNWFENNRQRLQTCSGFILKSKSPSCGYKTTPHFRNNKIIKYGNGYFVHLLRKQYPKIAIIDEKSLKSEKKLQQFKKNLNL
ncbi:MAG TPA: DUF523 domain-containing protein [Oceanospirillales bacterium]|nr:DUF523 domain-containing protein [Oceanospirillales bacterium]